MMSLLALLVCAILYTSCCVAWEEVRELRIPGELRIVNEGLSHDDQYWYLSNQHVLYKTEQDPMKIVLANYHAIPSELGQRRYDHIGDIDVFEGKHYCFPVGMLLFPSLTTSLLYGKVCYMVAWNLARKIKVF